MRDYGKVHTSFWSSQTIKSLSEDGRTLALYLLTSPHSTIAGVFRLPDGYVCEDIGWTSARVAKGFAELLANGYANRCETTKWVWICKHLEWNPPENPNQRKSAAKMALSVPDECGWKLDFMRVCGEVLAIEQPQKANPSATVEQPLPNQEQKQEQKQDKPTASGFTLPDWIPKPAWDGFVEMRKRKRAVLTDRAKELKVKELDRLRKAGFDVGTILDKSTENSWTDLYEPKPGRAPAAEHLAGAI